jgi:squalene-hopene/tetraprenyl-beta-curcumene cyclase
MNMKDLVQFAPTVDAPWESAAPPTLAPSYHQLLAPLRLGILRARQHLLNQQRDDGTWVGRRLGNASLPSQLVLLLAFRGEEQTPLARQAAEAILWQQLQTGGWAAFPGGPADLSVSVQAYFALKLTGHAASDERLSLARTRIRQLGGADAADATTRLFLALLGQVEYDYCIPWCEPASASQRIVLSHRPVRELGLERGVRELFVKKPCEWPWEGDPASGDSRLENERQGRLPETVSIPPEEKGTVPFFLATSASSVEPDSEKLGQSPAVLSSSLEALEFAELVWQAIALDAIDLESGDVVSQVCEARLRELIVVDPHDDLAQPQPGITPIVDTAMAIRALRDSGLEPDSPVLCEAVELLCSEGWIDAACPAELAWCSEALAAVEPALRRPGDALPPRIQMAASCPHGAGNLPCRFGSPGGNRQANAHRSVERLVELQQSDGGWGMDRRGNYGPPIPSALRTPPSALACTPEVTGAVLEALARHNMRVGNQAVDRAVAWLRDMQQADGSWDSATGVRWIHGTSQVVRGLLAAGVAADDPAVAAGVNWLLAYQQPSGGWGEAIPAEPHEPLYYPGPATATQTGWALLALLSAGRVKHEAVGRGIQFLLDTQHDDGRWEARQFTVRLAVRGAWHRNELGAVVWPLMALSRWAVAAAAAQRNEPDPVCLRLVGDPLS